MTSPDTTDGQNLVRELMRNQRRDTDISPDIALLHADPFGSVSPYDALLDSKKGDILYPEALRIWTESKPRIYALTAVCLEEIWKLSADDRRMHLSSNEAPYPDTVHVLRSLTDVILERSLATFIKTQKQEQLQDIQMWSPATYAYTQLARIIDFSREHEIIDNHTVSDFIHRGIITASHMTWATIDIVPTLAQRQQLTIPKQEKLAIMRKAYTPVISLFSHMNASMGVPLMDVILNQQSYLFDPTFFSLRQRGEHRELYMDHAKLLKLHDTQGTRFADKIPFADTIWCPANYAQGENGSVVYELFEWTVAMADKYLASIQDVPQEKLLL